MAKAAATLLVLLSCLWPTVQAEPRVLSCSFTVKTRSKSTEIISQCSVDGVPLYLYGKNNTRKEGNAPKECADLFSKLEDIEEELTSQLDTMGDHSLQVTMVSQYTEGQLIDAYCNFTLDEQYSFIFNLKNRKWREIHNNIPGIDKWKNNTELVKHLETFLIGDCGLCRKTLLLHWEKMPRSTSRAPDIENVTPPTQLPSTMNATQLPSTMNATQLPSTMNATQLPSTMNATQLPSTTQPPSKGGSGVTEGVSPIVIFIVIVSVLAVIICICLCIYKCVKRKTNPQGGKMRYKLCILDSCIFGNCRGQHTPSAMGEPCPEESICMTVMSPLEGDSPHCSSASSS